MAHKTLISGTAYEISGGKTLVNGTAYSIKNGKTLVGGTNYEVLIKGFIPLLELGNVTFAYSSFFKFYEYNFTTSAMYDKMMSANALMIDGEVILFPYILGISSDTVISVSTFENGGIFPENTGEMMFQLNIEDNTGVIRSADNLGTCNITIGIMR